VICKLCGSQCEIGEGERGFCGLRTVQEGKIQHLAGTPQKGVLHWYRDPLPTNCVADWVCPGSLEYGKHNLAVFYASCTLDCLFCQNWHYREVDAERSEGITAQGLADCANRQSYCVCYFGGDPASQMAHALASVKALTEKGVVVCWETAGTANPKLMDRAVRYSIETGGCVKFDLKAYTEALHRALTGRPNHQTLENFARAGERIGERPESPLVIASTLLVPGYVEVEEVRRIAAFIASVNKDIPYALLAFVPQFMMTDLPRTSAEHAEAAYQVARGEGLTNVRIGNRHLLGFGYDLS
jgi:pyruvate formate lyase activating enzyme